MNFVFENQGTNTFLVYEIQTTDELDSMSLGMLTNNKIPGFADASFSQMDTTKYIKYNVSAKVSVSDLFSGPVNKKRLVGVLSGIVDAMLSAEEYMLDPQTILLDLKHIYTDVTTCETVLICLPVIAAENMPVDLGMFFKNIIFTTQFDQTENCDHVAKIINFLNAAAPISLENFKNLLDSIRDTDKPKVVQAKQQPVVKQEPAHPVVQPKVPAPVPDSTPIVQYQVQQPAAQYTDLKVGTNYEPKKEPANTQPDPVQQAATEEKPMSLFYLLQHYNKENAATYKAQQEAKKIAGNNKTNKKQLATKEKAPAERASPGFAIPGQETQISKAEFAVPGVQKAPAQPASAVPVQSTPQQPIQQPVQQAMHKVSSLAISSGTPINFGETTVLGGVIGETTVLGGMDTSKPNPHLIRIRNNERIPLTKPVFRIGKERSYVDYFISDNTAVSRSHANIINRDGVFFVVDTNSTNHTYVNGTMIPSNVETKLSHGAKVRLANEDFEFRMN